MLKYIIRTSVWLNARLMRCKLNLWHGYRMLLRSGCKIARPWKSCCTLSYLIMSNSLFYTLDTNMRIWVQERKPLTSDNDTCLADDLEQPRKQTERGPGRMPRPPSRPGKCFSCHEPRHLTWECPKAATNDKTAAVLATVTTSTSPPRRILPDKRVIWNAFTVRR